MEFSTRGMKVKLQTTSSNRNADQFTIDSKNLTLIKAFNFVIERFRTIHPGVW